MDQNKTKKPSISSARPMPIPFAGIRSIKVHSLTSTPRLESIKRNQEKSSDNHHYQRRVTTSVDYSLGRNKADGSGGSCCKFGEKVFSLSSFSKKKNNGRLVMDYETKLSKLKESNLKYSKRVRKLKKDLRKSKQSKSRMYSNLLMLERKKNQILKMEVDNLKMENKKILNTQSIICSLIQNENSFIDESLDLFIQKNLPFNEFYNYMKQILGDFKELNKDLGKVTLSTKNELEIIKKNALNSIKESETKKFLKILKPEIQSPHQRNSVSVFTTNKTNKKKVKVNLDFLAPKPLPQQYISGYKKKYSSKKKKVNKLVFKQDERRIGHTLLYT